MMHIPPDITKVAENVIFQYLGIFHANVTHFITHVYNPSMIYGITFHIPICKLSRVHKLFV